MSVAVGATALAAALMTAWFYIGGMETEGVLPPDDADLCWTPPEVADADNAFIAILAATNHINLVTNSCGGFDAVFIGRYGNLGDENSRRVREEAGATEKADAILAENAAFFAAFAKGMERKGFRNNLPAANNREPILPIPQFMCMAWLWRFKAQRDAESGRWDGAIESVEMLHRFGRMLSDNAAQIVDLYIGNAITGMAYAKICDFVSLGILQDTHLARLAALVEADAMAENANLVRVAKSSYAIMRDNASELPPETLIELCGYGSKAHGSALAMMHEGAVESASPLARFLNFSIRTLLRWPGYSGYTLHRRRTLNSLENIVRAAVEGDVGRVAALSGAEPGSLFAQDALGRQLVRVFAVNMEQAMAGRLRREHMFARAKARVVLAAARWRLARNDEALPSLEALVPEFLPAVPSDPWSKGGERLKYDAESCIAWSVGRDGRFDYTVMKNAKPSLRMRLQGKFERCTFRLENPFRGSGFGVLPKQTPSAP